jgi:hypothetical protein
MIARALRSVPDARAHPGAGSPGRRDRRPIGPPRRGHPPPARAHPRVRCPGRLEQRLSLLRRLADLANRARPGRRPPPGRPAHARGPAASRSARRSCKGPRGAERRRRAPSPCANGNARLDGRIPRCRLGNRRFAPIWRGGVRVRSSRRGRSSRCASPTSGATATSTRNSSGAADEQDWSDLVVQARRVIDERLGVRLLLDV